MEALDNSAIPLSFSSQFLWNRDFNIRWDLTRNLQFSFRSATHAEVEEPYRPVNKDLYPDDYKVWKDSVWTSIKNLGTPLDYSQNVTASYNLPLNLIPVFDWLSSTATYSSSYNWVRGTALEDGTSLGNTVSLNRTYALKGSLAMEKLYNHVPFLKKANERFSKPAAKAKPKAGTKKKAADKDDKKADAADKEKSKLPLNRNTTQVEMTLYPDSAVSMRHNRKSKRIVVSAKSADGKAIAVKFKKQDDNTILVKLKGDTAQKVKLSVTKLPDLDEKPWYRLAQSAARFLMMLRTIDLTYNNSYAMSLPGFMPSVGDAFGQKSVDGILSPGLDLDRKSVV